MARIEIPNIDSWFENGKPTQSFIRLVTALTNQQTIDGEGSPEGVVDAPFKAEYWDRTGQRKYIKTTAAGTFGWVVIG